MDGGIFGDEAIEEPILDIDEDDVEVAQRKASKGEDLFPEDEEEEDKPKRSRGESTRTVPEVSQDLLDEVGDALSEFDAETANKKQIRKVRKALQLLSLARYPKKKKEKKIKKVAKTK